MILALHHSRVILKLKFKVRRTLLLVFITSLMSWNNKTTKEPTKLKKLANKLELLELKLNTKKLKFVNSTNKCKRSSCRTKVSKEKTKTKSIKSARTKNWDSVNKEQSTKITVHWANGNRNALLRIPESVFLIKREKLLLKEQILLMNNWSQEATRQKIMESKSIRLLVIFPNWRAWFIR